MVYKKNREKKEKEEKIQQKVKNTEISVAKKIIIFSFFFFYLRVVLFLPLLANPNHLPVSKGKAPLEVNAPLATSSTNAKLETYACCAIVIAPPP